MRKRLIISGLILALIITGLSIAYLASDDSESGDNKIYFFTDAPGYTVGQATISGEVFLIDRDDPFFDR